MQCTYGALEQDYNYVASLTTSSGLLKSGNTLFVKILSNMQESVRQAWHLPEFNTVYIEHSTFC